jgi:peptidoglycan/LPS O-acetylase OafA/YrhL
MSIERDRIPLIDAIKVVAAQLIVLHHLAWYGPMSDTAAALAPWLANGQNWLAEYGRYAVAAFLAMGGYLAATVLSPRGLPLGKSPVCLITQRYVRLVGPYAVALLLAIISAAWARKWMVHDSIGAAPHVWQVLSHLLLLHDLFDYEALSAGVWYVAIDFQLFALLVLLLWGARYAAQLWGHRRASPTGISFGHAEFFAPLLVTLLALVSLFHFNRDPMWDSTALYFFGAYALGVASCWAVRSVFPYRGLLAVALIGVLALAVDFRPRIAVALCVALALGLAQLHLRMTGMRPLASLGRISYALFLVHFPVCLVVNAAVQRFAPADPLWNACGVLLAWGASNAAAVLFYRHVEVRLANWRPSLPLCLTVRQAY